MQRTSRMIDPAPRLATLEQHRDEVQDRIERLAKRHYLTPAEEAEEKKLKHERLHVLDMIDSLERRS